MSQAPPCILIPVPPARQGAALQVGVECVMVPVCTAGHTGLLWLLLPFLPVLPCSGMGHLLSAVPPGVSPPWCEAPYNCSPSRMSLLWQDAPLTWRASSRLLSSSLSSVPPVTSLQKGLPPRVSSPHDCGSPLNTYELRHKICDFRGQGDACGGARTGCKQLQLAAHSCLPQPPGCPTSQTSQAWWQTSYLSLSWP